MKVRTMTYKIVLSLFCLFASAFSVVYYQNPVVKADTPDPGVIYTNGKYYVANTGGSAGSAFPIRSSTDLAEWKEVSHIFPKGHIPTWASSDFWAPEIHLVENKFVAYYAARDKDGVLSVGAAVSDNVLGPYKDIGQPLVHNATMGNIDPTFFKDPQTNKSYVIWKEDGNGASPPEKYTPIWAAEVSSNGLRLIGDRVKLLENNPDSWEGILVEGPWMIYQHDYYYLFYSANEYGTTHYAIGVARASKILGPYEKFSKNPILHSNTYFSGPGHCSVVSLKNENEANHMAIIYHSWIGTHIGPGYSRELMLDPIVWDYSDGYWPYVPTYTPSHTKEPVPTI